MRRPYDHSKPSEWNNKLHTHKNRWVLSLRRAGLMYGVSVLEKCPDNESLLMAEKKWIAHGRAIGWNLTNLTDGGEGNCGWHPSPETVAKNSLAHRGKKLPPETCSNMSRGHVGLHHSSETRAKIGAAHRGRKHSAEHRAHSSAALRVRMSCPDVRAKLSAARRGRKISMEQRAKISAAQRGRPGRPMTPEHIARLRAVNLGRPLSPEHRAKLCAARQRQIEARRPRIRINLYREAMNA